MRENLLRFINKSTKILLICTMLLMANALYAAHLKGGYIEYEYISSTSTTTTYKVTVYQYLDCGSTMSQRDQDVNLGIFNNATNSSLQSITVNRTGARTVQKENFECVQNPPQVCYIIDSYETVITLNNNSAGYQLYVQRCCRIGNIVNVSNSGNTGANYYISIPGTPTSTLLQNSSPTFNMNDTVLLCANNEFKFKFDAIDKDGDSLSYAFTYGLNTPSTDPKPLRPADPPFNSLPYVIRFSGDNPFGNANIKINPLNGEITGMAPSRSGDYVLAILISEYRNGVKIGEARKEIHVTISNCNIPEAILPESIITCTTFSVSLENQSSTTGNQTYYWDFGVPDTDEDISTSPTPTYIYKDTGTYTVKVVVNRGTYCSDSATMNMKVYPGFKVGFEAENVCINKIATFKDTSHTTFGKTLTKSWIVNNVVQSSTASILPVTFPAAGTYPVKLIASDNLGCKDSVTKDIQVFALPDINLVSDTLICINDSIRFNVSNSGTASWTPVYNILNEKSLTPTVFPKRNQAYSVQLTDINGCVNNKSVQVNTRANLNLQVTNNRTACEGDEVELTASSTGTSFKWEGNGLSNATQNSVKITAVEGAGTYYVNTYFGQNCTERKTVNINVLGYPKVSAGNDTTICYNALATLAGATNTPNYYWEQLNSPLAGNNVLRKTVRLTDNAVFILHAESNDVCRLKKTDTVLVNVVPDVIVDAGPNTELFLNLPYTIEATSNGNYTYKWTPSLGILKDTALNAVINIDNNLINAFGRNKTYLLTASTKEGCSATDNVTFNLNITVKKLYVPTGFTPNGDGKNDVLKPIYMSVGTLLYFRVYNRYGQLVFETNTWNKGWDGTFKGNPSPSGAYIFDCQVKEDTGNILHQKGSFALIR
ncbi:T9SS type B sorting domain-containing protein [Polluticaenibacter yanchengensis]|uniref:T9SS type B sorting domain-containing protein n=1 Tax=Polluticaenibacter yanchengensis TaxID=3014562 RepID=A0ABT4UQ41_9BACT|nr:T9SS type B sorting domain-containing protein [Chitinophagaceae bacterium LY-5]